MPLIDSRPRRHVEHQIDHRTHEEIGNEANLPTRRCECIPPPPIELLVEILKNCPDFTCLWSLINASPNCLAAFSTAALGIVEALIDSDANSHPLLSMRAVLCLRTGIFEVALREVHESPLAKVWTSLHESLPRRGSYQPTTLIPTLRAFVHLGYKIHGLAHFCLRRRFEVCRISRSDEQDSAPAPLCTLEHLQETPSWVEQRHMVSALWNLQFLKDMAEVWRDGRLCWVHEDSRHLPGIRSTRTYLRPLVHIQNYCVLETHEFKSAAALLANLRSSRFRPARSIADVEFEDDFGRAYPTYGEDRQSLERGCSSIDNVRLASLSVGRLGHHWVVTSHRVPSGGEGTLHKLGLCFLDNPHLEPNRLLELLSDDGRDALRRELARGDEPGLGPVSEGL
nr:hypothetical protein CFP56_11751 [Quercus suber]